MVLLLIALVWIAVTIELPFISLNDLMAAETTPKERMYGLIVYAIAIVVAAASLLRILTLGRSGHP